MKKSAQTTSADIATTKNVKKYSNRKKALTSQNARREQPKQSSLSVEANEMTGNTVLASCKNCGLDITKNNVESRTEAIGCINYHVGELQDQIKALEAKKTLLTGELEALKSGFCGDCGHEYKAMKFTSEVATLRAELKDFMEAV